MQPSVMYDTDYSDFISDAHANNLTVIPYSLKNDLLQLTPTLDAEIAILIVKGVDGVFTDFVHSTYKSFCLYGSKSNFPSLNQTFSN